jgi:hypothetical protein
MTQPSGESIFRPEALARYAAAQEDQEIPRDIPARLLLILWIVVVLVGGVVTGLAALVALR